MLAELEAHPLIVILAPSRRGEGCIRVCASVPPPWYRKLCAKHPSSRAVRRGKFDTRIRRQNILSVLTRLANGKPSVSKYAPYLQRVARKREMNPF